VKIILIKLDKLLQGRNSRIEDIIDDIYRTSDGNLFFEKPNLHPANSAEIIFLSDLIDAINGIIE
jgi:hypothetical protein